MSTNKPAITARDVAALDAMKGMCAHGAYPGVNCRVCEAEYADLKAKMAAIEAKRAEGVNAHKSERERKVLEILRKHAAEFRTGHFIEDEEDFANRMLDMAKDEAYRQAARVRDGKSYVDSEVTLASVIYVALHSLLKGTEP